MAAPGFAIPNIIGNLAIAPGQVSKKVVAVKRNGSRKKRRVVLARTVGKFKNFRPKAEGSRGESRMLRLKTKKEQDGKSVDEATALAKGKGKALLAARPSNKAIMLNANERGPMASTSNMSISNVIVPFPALPQANLETASRIPHSPSAISLTAQSLRFQIHRKISTSELSLSTISAPIPFKASQILGLENGLPREPTPNLLEKGTSAATPTRGESRSEEVQSQLRPLSHQSPHNIPLRPKLPPVWKPRPSVDSSNVIELVMTESTASLNSTMDSASLALTESMSNESTGAYALPLLRKRSQRALTPRHAGIIDGVLFPGTGSPNVQMRPLSLPSSTCSEASVGTLILLGSNFRFDDPSVVQADSYTIPPSSVITDESPVITELSQLSNQNADPMDESSRLTSLQPTAISESPDTFKSGSADEAEALERGIAKFQLPTTMYSPLMNAMKWRRSTEAQKDTAHGKNPTVIWEQGIPTSMSAGNSLYNTSHDIGESIALSLSSSSLTPTSTTSPSSPSKSLFTVRSPSNPAWLPRLDPSQEHTFIIVGEHTVPKAFVRMRLPYNMLEQNSTHLKAIIDVTKTIPACHRSPLRFPDVEPRIFELWLRWIYFRDITLHENTGKKNHKVRAPCIETLLKAWELGKNLIDPTLQDACVDHIIQLARPIYPSNFSRIKHVYNITNHGSGLRRLFLAMMCEDKLPTEWRRDDSIAIGVIGEAAFADYKAERKENGRRWDRRRANKEKDSWRSGGCRFHEHGVMENGVCGWRLRKSGFDDDSDDA